MLSPTSVRIEVEENKIIGRVQYEGTNVYFDSDGVVQEITDTIYAGIPLVAGIEIEKPQLYQKLVIENTALMRTMLNISQLLVKSQIIPDSVTFDGSQNMILRFGPVTVLLGQDEYLEEKVANLVSIYPQIEGETGTLNMEGFTGKNEAITFQADSGTPEPETEETESADQAAASQDGEETAQESAPSDTLAGEGATAQEPAEEENPSDGTGEDTAQEGQEEQEEQEGQEELSTSTAIMVFDSSGTLRYDAHVSNGQVVDSYGNVIDGCSVDENGNVVDAYWNVIDPATGQLAQ